MQDQVEKQALLNIDDDSVAKLVQYCDEDYAASLSLTKEEIDNLKNSLNKDILSDDFSLPMICQGIECPMAHTCPLNKLNKAPIGKRCSIELLLVNKWKKEYVESLDIDWNDHIERRMIIELVELDILTARANNVLAEEGFIMENAIGINEQTGAPIYKKEPHIALSLKDIVYKRRSKILKEMAATREAKLKFLAGHKADPSKYAAELRAKAEELRGDHEKVKIIDISADDIEEKTDENKK